MKDYVLFTFMQVELKGICLVETGEGNGSPLQYACLENPVDGGAWWATAHGVSNSYLKKVRAYFLFLSQNSVSALKTCLMEEFKRHTRSHPSQISPRSTSSSQPSI